ncbi:unnamed protein product [Bubo scandiacus]
MERRKGGRDEGTGPPPLSFPAAPGAATADGDRGSEDEDRGIGGRGVETARYSEGQVLRVKWYIKRVLK